MRDQERSNLIKTGIFISALLAVFMIFATLIGKENQWFADKVRIKATVASANNLRPGGVVQLQGIKIGNVVSVDITGRDQVELILEINQAHLKWIKKDSTVDISSQGLVGDKIIKIRGGSESAPPFDPSTNTLSPHPSMQVPDIAQTGGEIAIQVDRVLAKLEIFLDQLNQEGKVAGAIDKLGSAAERLNNILSVMEKKGIAHKMSSAMGELDMVMGRINRGPGTMHSLIYEDELYQRMSQIVGGAGRSDVLKYFIRRSLDEEDTP